jgi:putative membrane protein
MNNKTINKDLILRENWHYNELYLTFFSILRTAMYFLIAGLSLKNVLKSKIVPSK